MSGFIPGFSADGVVTVNRVLLKPKYSVDDLEERVALLCENVKTYHSDTGFVGGFVALNHQLAFLQPIPIGLGFRGGLWGHARVVGQTNLPVRGVRARDKRVPAVNAITMSTANVRVPQLFLHADSPRGAI